MILVQMRLVLGSLVTVTACAQVYGFEPATLECDGDNFDGDSLNPDRWVEYTSGEPPRVLERNGHLEIDIAPNALGYGGVQSRDPLEPDELAQVELVKPNSTPNTQAVIALFVDADNAAYLSKNDDQLRFAVIAAGSVAGEFMTPYAPEYHRFMRIEHAGDQARFSTSGDGMHWSVNQPVEAAWGAIRPTIILYAGRNATATAFETIAFDNLVIATPTCTPRMSGP